MADGVGFIADAHGIGVAQCGRYQQFGQLARLEDGNIILGLGGDNLAGSFGAIGKEEANGGGVLDDVQTGEDVAAVVDDDAATKSTIVFIVFTGGAALDQNERRLDEGGSGINTL